jgi:hypothetical protein
VYEDELTIDNITIEELYAREITGQLTRDDWYDISETPGLSEDIIREFAKKVDWERITDYQDLSWDFIEEFADKVDWQIISGYANLTEDAMERFELCMDWDTICHYQTLSESFMRRNINILLPYFDLVCYKQKLSESFIEDYSDQVEWNWISLKQNISFNFIIKHWKELNPYCLMQNYNLKNIFYKIAKIIINIIYKFKKVK